MGYSAQVGHGICKMRGSDILDTSPVWDRRFKMAGLYILVAVPALVAEDLR